MLFINKFSQLYENNFFFTTVDSLYLELAIKGSRNLFEIEKVRDRERKLGCNQGQKLMDKRQNLRESSIS